MHNGASRSRRGMSGFLPSSTRHGEDTQPNETIDKRQAAAPPSILTVSTPQRFNHSAQYRVRGRGIYLGRGRNDAIIRPGTRGAPIRDGQLVNAQVMHAPSENYGSSYGTSYKPDVAPQDQSVTRQKNNRPRNPIAPSFSRTNSTLGEPTHSRINGTLNELPRPQSSHSSSFHVSDITKERPFKRRRTEAEPQPLHNAEASSSRIPVKQEKTTHTSSMYAESSQSQSQIKREARSPSPPVHPGRRLVTSGCVRYAPLPNDCRRESDPLYKVNRKKWAQREMDKLVKKGLYVTRWLTREDGMAIEWSSSSPVWSDTLEFEGDTLPPPVRGITSSGRRHRRDDVSTGSRTALSETPGESMGIRTAEILEIHSSLVSPSCNIQHSSSQSEPAETINILTCEGQPTISMGNEHDNSITPAPRGSQQLDEIVGQSPPLEDENALERSALKFIERYMQLFDVDRAALHCAYHSDAFFSFRFHNTSNISSTATFGHQNLSLPKNVFQGRERIGRALRLLNCYKVCQEETSIIYDLLLGNENILITCYGSASNADKPPPAHVFFGQSFVLRKNTDSSQAEEWPLVAVSHQVTIGNFSADIFTSS